VEDRCGGETVTTPPQTRRELVLQALAAGVPTIADKPFAPARTPGGNWPRPPGRQAPRSTSSTTAAGTATSAPSPRRARWATDAAPSAADANKVIDEESFEEFSEWHLGINPDASEGTKGRFAFPYGDFTKVNRAALIHAKQRAAQNDHDEVEKAADDLLQRLDDKRS